MASNQDAGAGNKAHEIGGKVESPARMAWRKFRKDKLGMLGLGILIIVALMAIFAPLLAPNDPFATHILESNEPPSSDFPLGTDRVGRCIFSRMLYGGRVSLQVGLIAMAISTVIGSIAGLLAGFLGGIVDVIIMRIVDIIRSVPFLVLAITIVAVFGPGLFRLMVVIGVLAWTGIARIVRGNVLSLREREFVHASKAIGASKKRIMFKHLLPNTVAPILVHATLQVAFAIISEAGLSFLGLGVQPPLASWGNMLNEARNLAILEDRPWFWIPPGLMIVITVLSINFMGDALRDALDPKQQRE